MIVDISFITITLNGDNGLESSLSSGSLFRIGEQCKMPYKNLMAPQVTQNFKKIKHRENAKASLYKYPGKSILNVNHVFLVRPICSVSGISFQRYLPNVSPNSMTQKMKSLHMFIFVKKLEVVHKYVGGCLITPDWLLKRSWGLSDWIFANVHVDFDRKKLGDNLWPLKQLYLILINIINHQLLIIFSPYVISFQLSVLTFLRNEQHATLPM